MLSTTDLPSVSEKGPDRDADSSLALPPPICPWGRVPADRRRARGSGHPPPHRCPGGRTGDNQARLRLLQPEQPGAPPLRLAGGRSLPPTASAWSGSSAPAATRPTSICAPTRSTLARPPAPPPSWPRRMARAIQTVYIYSKPEWAALVVAAGLRRSPRSNGAEGQEGRRHQGHRSLLLPPPVAQCRTAWPRSDVEVINLQHADGKTALERGDVDAWSGLDPLMAQTELEQGSTLIYRNIDFNTLRLPQRPPEVHRAVPRLRAARPRPSTSGPGLDPREPGRGRPDPGRRGQALDRGRQARSLSSARS